MLLKPIETPETVGQGKIILTPATREALTMHQMEVVDIGAPALCEDADCERFHSVPRDKPCKAGHWHPRPCAVGEWVLVRHRSLLETHQDGLYCCHQDDVLAVLIV